MEKRIYLAGGLFNAGERLHNLYLEKYLKLLGYKVILPQREALKHFKNGRFDLEAIAEECARLCSGPDTVCVANVDGPDADSGTSAEYSIAIERNGRAIVCRTDFRTDLTQELGVNAMFKLKGSRIIFKPCFFTEIEEVEPYYKELAQKIHEEMELLID